MTPGIYSCPDKCEWTQIGPNPRTRAPCKTCNSTGSTMDLVTYTQKAAKHDLAVVSVYVDKETLTTRVAGLVRTPVAVFSVDVPISSVELGKRKV